MHDSARQDPLVIEAIGRAAPLGRLPEFIPMKTTESFMSAATRAALIARKSPENSFQALGIGDSELAELVGPVVVANSDHLPVWAETLVDLIDWWESHSAPTWPLAVQAYLKKLLTTVTTSLSPAAQESLITQALSTGFPLESPRKLLIDAPARAYAVAVRITSALSNFTEFAERLDQDRELLSEFIHSPCTSITHLTVDCGDPHNGQRSVMIVTFDSGNKVVYKTKDLRVQQLWNSVLELIDPAILRDFEFRGPQPVPVMVRDQYAWVKYLEQNPAQDDPEAVHRFMVRMGVLALVASRLRANDLWADNLITQIDQPYIIDVETLLQPLVDTHFDAPHLSTGIVSLPTSPHPDLPATELGALTYAGSIASGIEARIVSSNRGSGFDAIADTDSQGRTWVSIVMDERRPTLHGQPPHIINQWDAFAQGYQAAAQALSNQSLELKDLLTTHSQDTSRVIIQGTFDYYRAMHSSWQPQYFTDTRSRTLALMRTMRSWHGGRFNQSPAIAWEEALALANGDIPYFTSHADSTDLFSGDTTLGQIGLRSGLESVLEKLANGGDVDHELSEIYAQVSTDVLDSSVPRPQPVSTRKSRSARVDSGPEIFSSYVNDLVDVIEAWYNDPHRRGVVEEPRSAMRTVGPVPFDIWNGGAAAALLLVEAGRDPHGSKLAQAITSNHDHSIRWNSPLRGPWLAPVSGVLVGLMSGLPAPLAAAHLAAQSLAATDISTPIDHCADGLGDRVWSQRILRDAGSDSYPLGHQEVAPGEPYWGLLPTTQIRRRQVAGADPHQLSCAELIALGEVPGRATEAATLLCRNYSETGRWLTDRLAADTLHMSGIWGLVGVARTLLRASGQPIPLFRDPRPNRHPHPHP